jgi:hypothetical protein
VIDANHNRTATRVSKVKKRGTRMILLVFATKSDEASITSIAFFKEVQ